jgi:hypothetical protein
MTKWLPILLLLASLSAADSVQEMTIGIIDFYGLRSIGEDQVRAVLPFSEGMSITDDYAFPDESSMSDIAQTLGVTRVTVNPICCENPFELIVYVGIEEEQSPGVTYRDRPVGDMELPREILDTASQLESAMIAAIQKGDSGEDRSQGHSLMMNPEARALQQRYIEYAESYRDTLIEVLHESAQQRALAAAVLAYAPDKKSVVPHLEAAVLDPDEDVRNDAARALALIAGYANENPDLNINIDALVFVDMLNSAAFSDRNKSAAVLLNLTELKNQQVIEKLRVRALRSLIEMCRWRSEGHAWTPCKLLERTVGLPDQDALHPKDRTIGAAMDLLRDQAL